MGNKEKLAVIVGPTAVGKTKVSIDVAKKLRGEIISGDSMQIYRGMDIGTAKIKKEEMQGIPHHLIDIKDPEESFSVAEFQRIVREKISEISRRGRLPMIVGGTGLYIQSVLYDYRFSGKGNTGGLRKELQERLRREGTEKLYRELSGIDPDSAIKIHPNDGRRIIRALEIYYSTGVTLTEHLRKQRNELRYDAAIVGLTMDRERLYRRIDERVDRMIEAGLLEEARRFYDRGLRGCQSIQAIGYKELYAYFDGTLSLAEAIALLKKNTRNYAKRQYTWFKNKMDVQWFDVEAYPYGVLIEKITEHIAGKLKISAK
ncbi:tRNA (adenosine(37)-N6)-dimethylallyltransferase MiaA [Caldibacillus debilis]|uniref:tRNA (adenosine(37)-N6)-dimethylallyltransferase MiaA n=1 Tax=Caldibacillus debilis TaxID=301148 RepID=UPI000E3B4132|nr:tRNA (adenosine(37)-N6)-dimethylallyltransferase MiaA [Caldibacillus debilis]REJ30343.1 MAG: tRNA (adenosine(37)-N6)-dimethylallyltransferase MiaA [Caldibacillus debilis]